MTPSREYPRPEYDAEEHEYRWLTNGNSHSPFPDGTHYIKFVDEEEEEMELLSAYETTFSFYPMYTQLCCHACCWRPDIMEDYYAVWDSSGNFVDVNTNVDGLHWTISKVYPRGFRANSKVRVEVMQQNGCGVSVHSNFSELHSFLRASGLEEPFQLINIFAGLQFVNAPCPTYDPATNVYDPSTIPEIIDHLKSCFGHL